MKLATARSVRMDSCLYVTAVSPFIAWIVYHLGMSVEDALPNCVKYASRKNLSKSVRSATGAFVKFVRLSATDAMLDSAGVVLKMGTFKLAKTITAMGKSVEIVASVRTQNVVVSGVTIA